MDQSKVEDFIANAALLAAHLSQQVDKSISDQQASTRDLRQTADAVKQSVAAGQVELAQQARNAVREALAQEVPVATQALREVSERMKVIAQQLQAEQSSAGVRMRFLGWQSVASLFIAAVLIVGGTAYLARQNVQRAQAASATAEVMEAMKHVAITSCDGRPCIKLAEGQQRWARNDDYILVDDSAAAGATPP